MFKLPINFTFIVNDVSISSTDLMSSMAVYGMMFGTWAIIIVLASGGITWASLPLVGRAKAGLEKEWKRIKYKLNKRVKLKEGKYRFFKI